MTIGDREIKVVLKIISGVCSFHISQMSYLPVQVSSKVKIMNNCTDLSYQQLGKIGLQGIIFFKFIITSKNKVS